MRCETWEIILAYTELVRTEQEPTLNKTRLIILEESKSVTVKLSDERSNYEHVQASLSQCK
jgi:hypothetical protein